MQPDAPIQAVPEAAHASLASVCLALGPYRNLTTLTAGILALHPRCQVLNHGGPRLLPDPEVDFLSAYRPARMEAFLRRAFELSVAGERGQSGGAIQHSHAFDPEHPLGRIYRRRFGERRLAERPACLFWKESLHTSNLLRSRGIDVGALLAADRRLRFLMPVRNPLDCARSNLRTEHTRYFRGLPPRPELGDVLAAVLDELSWVADLRAAHPGRVHLLVEHRLGPAAWVELARFLELEPEERWLRDAQEALCLKPGYAHPPADVARYAGLVRERFVAHPELRAELLAFTA